MTQHTFILPINGATFGIEFEETQYKLNAGEMLVGQHNDIPEKKQIGHVITAFDGIEVFEQEIRLTTPLRVGTPRYMELESILETLFDSLADNSRGITVEFDLHFYMNHAYLPNAVETLVHYSSTANIKVRFSIIRTETQDYYYSAPQYIMRRGKYVQYFSETGNYYQSVQASGDLVFGQIPSDPYALSVTSAGLLKLENNLDDHLYSSPQFDTAVFGKMRVFEYSFDTETFEEERV
jgi:hypothetical protein